MISDSKSNHQSPNIQVPVFLNVYNFWGCFNKVCEPFGIGVYHTGVQFYDDEYMFFGFDGDQTGVGYIEPFEAAYEFKQQILLGFSQLTFFEFDEKVLDPLRLEFTGNKYDLLENNCNHFARRLTKQLKVSEKFPQKIFRITDFCNLFRCCIPQCILNGRLDWFDWEGSVKQEPQYHGLEESVKDQIDIKILQKQQKHRHLPFKETEHKRQCNERLSIHNAITRQQILRVSHTDSHHQIPEKTTLRKGIWPHLENAHQRASLHELPNISPRSLGRESIHLSQSKINQPQTLNKRYPNENVSIFAGKKQTHFQQ